MFLKIFKNTSLYLNIYVSNEGITRKCPNILFFPIQVSLVESNIIKVFQIFLRNMCHFIDKYNQFLDCLCYVNYMSERNVYFVFSW